MSILFCQCSCLKRMRKSKPQPIGSVVKDVVRGLESGRARSGYKIAAQWPAVVGQKLAGHLRPVGLRNGVLKVVVADSAWFYQANLQKEPILKRLQRRFGPEKIKDLQFRMGQIKQNG